MPILEKKDRNAEIYAKKKAGATYRQLSSETGLSIQALYTIIKRIEMRERLKKDEKGGE